MRRLGDAPICIHEAIVPAFEGLEGHAAGGHNCHDGVVRVVRTQVP